MYDLTELKSIVAKNWITKGKTLNESLRIAVSGLEGAEREKAHTELALEYSKHFDAKYD